MDEGTTRSSFLQAASNSNRDKALAREREGETTSEKSLRDFRYDFFRAVTKNMKRTI